MPIIASAHFESLDSAPVRKVQMEASMSLLHSIHKELDTGVVLCGDFNFDPKWVAEEAVFTSNGFRDVMPEFIGDAFTMLKTP